MQVIMANLQGEVAMAKLSDLLPRAFTGRCLKRSK